MKVFLKDPADRLDYKWDFIEFLTGAEAITSFVITPPAGITVGVTSSTSTTVAAWIEGGTDGESYTIPCRITSSEGRIVERSITLHVRNL